MLEQIIQFCQANGLLGLLILAFTDSFISPIMPDIILVPLCLSEPQNAIYYSALATLASVIGGYIGYNIGAKLGPVCVSRFIPDQHWERIRALVEKHGVWAVFWGAIAPIPYKFVSISAGVLGLNARLFLIITIIGRSKRFLLEGILLFYFGPSLIEFWAKYDEYGLWLVVILGVVAFIAVKIWNYYNQSQLANKQDKAC